MRARGAAFSLLLEEKTALGSAAPPPERIPVESLGEEELIRRALAEREERSRKEKIKLQSRDPLKPWTDYTITSAASGKSYRVAAWSRAWHLLLFLPRFSHQHAGYVQAHHVRLRRVERKFSEATLCRPYRRQHLSVHLTSGDRLALRLGIPNKLDERAASIIEPLAGRDILDVHDLVERLTKLERLGQKVTVYPDAEEFIQRRLFQNRIQSLVDEIRRDPRGIRSASVAQDSAVALPARRHRLCRRRGPGDPGRRHGPGQDHPGRRRRRAAGPRGRHRKRAGRLPGVAQVAVAERNPAVLRTATCSCVGGPASRAAGPVRQRLLLHDLQLRAGAQRHIAHRAAQVGPDRSGRGPADQELGGEDQPNVVKGLKSPFALVLSGTPLENRARRAVSVSCSSSTTGGWGPASASSTITASSTRRARCWATRTWTSCASDCGRFCSAARATGPSSWSCPSGPTEIVRIPPTDEQHSIHDGPHADRSPSIVRKKFLTEMDLLRLRMSLLMCRMAANSTFLVR